MTTTDTPLTVWLTKNKVDQRWITELASAGYTDPADLDEKGLADTLTDAPAGVLARL